MKITCKWCGRAILFYHKKEEDFEGNLFHVSCFNKAKEHDEAINRLNKYEYINTDQINLALNKLKSPLKQNSKRKFKLFMDFSVYSYLNKDMTFHEFKEYDRNQDLYLFGMKIEVVDNIAGWYIK